MAREYFVLPPSLRFHRLGFKWPGALAFMLYAAISFSFVAYALHGDFSGRYLGTTADPAYSMWILAWWHYALGHHLNPFMPHVLWAPQGTNLAWSTCFPLAAFLAYPLTHFFGIVATYNLLCALSLALAGWAAFFFLPLCTRLVLARVSRGLCIWLLSLHAHSSPCSSYDAAHFPSPAGRLSRSASFRGRNQCQEIHRSVRPDTGRAVLVVC